MAKSKAPNSIVQNIIDELTEGELKKSEKQEPTKKRKVSVSFIDPSSLDGSGDTLLSAEMVTEYNNALSGSSPLVKSVLNVLNGGKNDSIERLAFETNPYINNSYQGLYRRKLRLLPDDLLKRISIQDDLVAAIANTRSNQIAAFGRPQPDRYSTGFQIEIEPEHLEGLDSQAKKDLQDKVKRVETILMSCGQTRGWEDHESLNFSQYLFMQARNAVIFGRCSTEIIYVEGMDGKKKFHSFRPIDAGTIYRASPQKEAAQQVRDSALLVLSQLKNKKLIPERYVNDEYAWVQVIEGRPMQAFTPEECLVHNFYPVTDIELDGYPVTPLDTVIAAVTTHINITTLNKLFFQNGRAARGMLVFKSDDVDEKIVSRIRQQFMASINSVGNAFRTPILGVGSDDDITWTNMDAGSRDMEFQYLSDTNARVILSAFQMSPEEIGGYAHLSRGTNSMALSESSTEYVLEASRDAGIRPLMSNMQNYINQRILPLIDQEVAKVSSLKFIGLDVDTPEKESIRLQGELSVHMTMDEVLQRVEKKPIGKLFGGQMQMNPQWHAILDSYINVGEIMEHFLGVEGASKDPRFQYLRDPFFFQWQQLQMQQEQMAQQAQQAQQAAQQPQGQPQPGQPGQGQPQDPQQPQQEPQDLTRSADQLLEMLNKSEAQLPAGKKRLLHHQRKIVEHALSEFEKDSKSVIDEILEAANHLVPIKLKE
jgi:hypothetical protein